MRRRMLGIAAVLLIAIAWIGGRNQRGGDRHAHAGAVVFDSDFETGVLPPWAGVQACPDRGTSFERVSSPRSHGRHAARATVSGTCDFGSQRAEVLGAHVYGAGDERYFGHSVLFPAGFPARQRGWCVTMQIHTTQRGERGRPSALSLNCRDTPSDTTLIRAQSNPGCIWKAPMVRGVWLHFVWRVRFSATNGDWDLWYRPDTERRYAHILGDCRSNALLTRRDTAYWKLGLYRGSANRGAVSVYHDDAKVGTSFEAVAP